MNVIAHQYAGIPIEAGMTRFQATGDVYRMAQGWKPAKKGGANLLDVVLLSLYLILALCVLMNTSEVDAMMAVGGVIGLVMWIGLIVFMHRHESRTAK
ncbi:hypothetical protein [Dyella telluris]|uniref:Uncharacterized protein n=1 Tax=Dyella telluris TaxID=2763498 RepID=A0A7G8Q4I7_9GAMM|nr:hypothetical protein [Dyella telluris]QNK01695.1 hypothetical protein H8F01_00500 [Dyella telluris]